MMNRVQLTVHIKGNVKAERYKGWINCLDTIYAQVVVCSCFLVESDKVSGCKSIRTAFSSGNSEVIQWMRDHSS